MPMLSNRSPKFIDESLGLLGFLVFEVGGDDYFSAQIQIQLEGVRSYFD